MFIKFDNEPDYTRINLIWNARQPLLIKRPSLVAGNEDLKNFALTDYGNIKTNLVLAAPYGFDNSCQGA